MVPIGNSMEPREGRALAGEQHYRALLTDAQADEIRLRVAGGEVQRRVAAEFGVSPKVVCLVVAGKTYTGNPAPRVLGTKREIDPEGRRCAGTCARFRSWDEFSPSITGLNGKSSRCRECCAAYQRAIREINPQGEKLRAFELGLKRKFNISLAQYERMEKEQDYQCALCREAESRKATGKNVAPGTVQRLSVDHDHGCCPGAKSCGKCVRGLLCAHCNWFVGRCEARKGRIVVLALPGYLQQRPLREEA